MGDVTIATDEGPVKVRAHAIVGALAVTLRQRDLGWTITHTPTGMASGGLLPEGLLSADQCERIARAWVGLLDWGALTAENCRELIDRDMQDRLRRVAREVSHDAR